MTIIAILSQITGMAAANALLSFLLTGIVVYLLLRYASVYNAIERLGHGMAGSAMFVSGFKQLGFAYLVAPFEPTYQMLWRLGWLLLLTGKLYRLHKHRIANEQQVELARAYFTSRTD